MKICFSTLGCVEYSLAQVVALAKKFSAEGLEIRGLDGQMNNGKIACLQPEKATETKRILSENGIKPTVLGTSCMFHNAEKYDAAIPEGKECILSAQRLEIPYIRVFGNDLTEPHDACISRVCQGIASLCRFAADKQVTVLLEVHGGFNTVESLSPVLERLQTYPNFGLIWDIAHSHRVYGTNWLPFYSKIRPFIRHVHVKDLSDANGKLTLPGDGDIPILPILKRLTKDGFDGYFSLEWERKWHPELPSIESALAAMQRLTAHLM